MKISVMQVIWWFMVVMVVPILVTPFIKFWIHVLIG